MDMEKKFNKVLNEYELTNSLLTEQKQKNQTLVVTLKKLETKLDEIKQENLQLRMEGQSGKNFTIVRQKQLMEEVEGLRGQIHEKSVEN